MQQKMHTKHCRLDCIHGIGKLTAYIILQNWLNTYTSLFVEYFVNINLFPTLFYASKMKKKRINKLTFCNRRLWTLRWRRRGSDVCQVRQECLRICPWVLFPPATCTDGSSPACPRRLCSPPSVRCWKLFSRKPFLLRWHSCMPRTASSSPRL